LEVQTPLIAAVESMQQQLLLKAAAQTSNSSSLRAAAVQSWVTMKIYQMRMKIAVAAVMMTML
jgi:hypothetical protein